LFSLRNAKGCVFIAGCELLISITVFSFFSVPSFASLLYGFSIIVVLERAGLFSFLEDKTVFEFIETSFHAVIKLIILTSMLISAKNVHNLCYS